MDEFTKMSCMIVANRLLSELKNVVGTVFTRDLFEEMVNEEARITW